MPLYISNEKPTYEGKYFVGWSKDKNATEATYYQNDIMKVNEITEDITLYAVWADDASHLPLLSQRVKVGDYVNYPVYYDNVTIYTNSETGDTYTASLNGWRVLSVSGDTVNLVSAGVPLTYYHYNNSETSIRNLAINFLDIPVQTTGNYVFRKSGFAGNIELQKLFNNKYTATYDKAETVSYESTYTDGTVVKYSGTKEAGDLKVRAMTKEDLDKVYDPTGEKVTEQGTYVTSAEYQKLLAIPAVETEGRYALYYLASAFSSTDLRFVNHVGGVSYHYYELGVRPVVSLKSTVKAAGTDMFGRWNIEI